MTSQIKSTGERVVLSIEGGNTLTLYTTRTAPSVLKLRFDGPDFTGENVNLDIVQRTKERLMPFLEMIVGSNLHVSTGRVIPDTEPLI